MNSKLEDNGYIHFLNSIGNLSLLKKSIVQNGTKIDNNVIKKFIDEQVVPIINAKMRWNMSYSKFRFSDFQNLTDAGTFHSDVYNFTDTPMQIYTIILYLDASELDIVPKTHINGEYSTLINKIKISMKPKDMLLFNAKMYHKGIPSNSEHRRILQIFEIFPNPQIEYNLSPFLFTVLTSNTMIGNIIRGSNGKKEISPFTEKLHYYLISKHLQYALILSDVLYSEKVGRFITYEPGMSDVLRPGYVHNWNVNIITRKRKILTPTQAIITNRIILICIVLFVLFYLRKR